VRKALRVAFGIFPRNPAPKMAQEAVDDLVTQLHAIDAAWANFEPKIDKASQRMSLNDLVAAVCRKRSGARLDRQGVSNIVAKLSESPEFEEKIESIYINGKGHLTPVAHAQTCILILFQLPGKTAAKQRTVFATLLCRLLGADATLVPELQARAAATPIGMKQFFQPPVARAHACVAIHMCTLHTNCRLMWPKAAAVAAAEEEAMTMAMLIRHRPPTTNRSE